MLLRTQQVATLVDVRTYPRSGYNPQYEQPALRAALVAAGVAYVFAGRELGGRPTDRELHGKGSKPDYDRVSATQRYQAGIEQLVELARTGRVAVMCSEANPATCHREKLIARSLRERGVTVLHIYPDGRVDEGPQPVLF